MRWSSEVQESLAEGGKRLQDVGDGSENRAEFAVERTAPMAFWLYSLIVIWYLRCGQHLRAARLPAMPWYQGKAALACTDMLAALRRSSWFERLSVPCANVPTLRKRIRPILEYAAA
jgi:hypothetical protein